MSATSPSPRGRAGAGRGWGRGYWFVTMEGSFETSYLLSRQTDEGVEGTDGKTATPPPATTDLGLTLGHGPPARGAAKAAGEKRRRDARSGMTDAKSGMAVFR